jgi:hypothetical protein
MSTEFVLALAGVVLGLVILRLKAPGLPFTRSARRLTPLGLTAVGVGALGLILHCTSMFFPQVVAAIPGTQGAISQINSMGAASMVWFAVPALLVLAGLRRQNLGALVLLAAALLAVGITMYNGSPASIHLATIFAAGIVLAATVLLFGIPPWQQNKTAAGS